jgi:hypothetical protein
MAKIKTPVIKAFREKGGTFCTFNSAIEDIGLNITEKSNKVRLSHYVVLDIPNCDYKNGHNSQEGEVNNVFNLLTPYSAFYNTINDDSYDGDVRENIAQSFMSYALNMESTIRNQKDKYSSYDFTSHLSISERVFWKWLKETGAIRWCRASKYEKGVEKTEDEEKNYDYFIEERDNKNGYKRVVKGFGAIDGVAQRTSDYGMYNEVYVNIPTSFGVMDNVFFKQIEDNNYKFGEVYEANTQNFFNLEGHEKSGVVLDTSLKNLGYFDYTNEVKDSSYVFYTNGTKQHWFDLRSQKPIQTSELKAYYIIDEKVDNNVKDASLNDLIEIKEKINEKDSNLVYKIQRSKLDCMSIELDTNNIAQIIDKDYITYDELNIGTNKEIDYNFNTLLVYYSVYDDNDNILATNLYGVYFIDAAKDKDDFYKNEHFRNFEFPRLIKKQSNTQGFGTSYSFKLNIRSASIYDNKETDIYDDSSAENSIVNDFSDVVANLNVSVDLLSKHVKSAEVLQNRYNELYDIVNSLNSKMTILQQQYNTLSNNDKDIQELYTNLDNLTEQVEELKNNFENNVIVEKENTIYFEYKDKLE